MEQSPPTIEDQLERAGRRLTNALDRIGKAAEARLEEVRDAGTGPADAIAAMQAKIDALEKENRKLREAGRTIADGIDETIEALRRARA